MAPEKSIQKAILLIGGGGNGKSTFIRLLLNFIGAENTVALSLHKLEADRFAVAKLLGKVANVCADLPTSHLQGTSISKAITGGDRIAGEYKFKPVFEFEPFCKLLFSANAPPMSSDCSAAFFDRWIVIPFERSFRGTPAEIPSEVLNERLANSSELSGLLNLAIAARKTLNTTKTLLQPESVRQARNRFQQATDPLAVFLDQHTQVDPQVVLPTVELRTAFNRSLTETGKPAMSDTGFGAHFQRIAGGKFDKKQRTIDGTVKWCYVGLKLV
jgi:putative DNA primase/helicase